MARYIDAEKAVEEARLSYCKDCNSYNGVRCSVCGFDDAMTYIEDAPTADVVEVKHGEWSLHPDGSGTCNLCGRTQKSVWDFDNVQTYCGKCGAKMDGGNKDDL